MEFTFKDLKGQVIKINRLGETAWGCTADGAAALWTQAIKSDKDVNDFFGYAERLDEIRRKAPGAGPFPLRMGSCQLSSPVTEWESVADQRLWLTWLSTEQGLSAQTAHLLLPTEPTFFPKDQEAPSEFLLKDLAQLTKLFNIAAYEMYCYWLAEEIEMFLEGFPLEGAELYTLEAHFKDFLHEVRVALIRHSESNFQENILAEGALQGKIKLGAVDKRSSLDIEREIFRTYSEGMKRLAVQNTTLVEIIRVILAIETTHPDLISMKREAIVLSALLTPSVDLEGKQASSWCRQFLLVQILNSLMGVVSGINTTEGSDRSRLALAVQLSLASVKREIGFDAVIDAVIHWDEAAGTQTETRKSHHMLIQKTIWRAIKEVSIPMAAEAGERHPPSWIQGQTVNEDVVKLLPSAATAEGSALLAKLVD